MNEELLYSCSFSIVAIFEGVNKLLSDIFFIIFIIKILLL